MTVLCYKLVDDHLELRSCFGSGIDPAEFRVEGSFGGFITVAGNAAEIKDGAARLSLSGIKDGRLVPTFNLGKKCYTADSLVKEGAKLRPSPVEEKRIRRLLQRVEALETHLKQAEERLCALEEKIQRNITL